jgi:pilus assembly protein Flp/PilA
MNIEDRQNTKAESEKGASLVEYALLVALIAVICIVALRTIGNAASSSFSSSASSLTGAG